MNRNLTDLTLVVDRSGSMQSIREDAEGGVNAFIERQSKEPGDALLTLVHFDTEYEFVHRAVPIDKVPPYSLVPRGRTALLDAIGRAINETGERLSAIPDADRPGYVVFVIMTDGHENASEEFPKAQVKTMIEHQQSVYRWEFVFLGANQDAFAEAGALGIPAGHTSNFSLSRVDPAIDGAASLVARKRRKAMSGEATATEFFTQDERDQMK